MTVAAAFLSNAAMRLRFAALLLLLPSLSGCDDVYDRPLVGRYRLQAIDNYDTMSIVWEINGDETVGDGLPGPMVFAAGYDDRYVVAAVHPYDHREAPNDAVTQYFYIDRRFEHDAPNGLPYRGIRGPFDQATYRSEKKRLGLPEFTWHSPKL